VKLPILLAVLTATASCGCPKPPPVAPAPLPQIVRITELCLDPLPELPAVRLPKIDPNATSVTIDAENYRALFQLIHALVDYVTTQQAKCGVISK
jgi:hypothetical protein